VRDGESNLSRCGWPSTNQLDDGGPDEEAEDESDGQETEFAWRHAVRILRLALLRVRGIIAG